MTVLNIAWLESSFDVSLFELGSCNSDAAVLSYGIAQVLYDSITYLIA